MPLIYAAISRGSTILAEFTSFSGNFSTVALQCLQKYQGQKGRYTFNCDRHTFNFLTDDDFTYTVVADDELGRQIPFAFLEQLQEDFAKKMAEKGKSAIAYSLTKEYGPRLQELMEYVSSNPEEANKVIKIQKQVDEVKNIMMENIEKVLERGEKLELLVDKTDQLRFQADTFHRSGRDLRRKMWWQNLRMRLLVGSAIFFFILIIFLFYCGGFKCLS